MIVVVILTIVVDRLIVKYGCLSLYKGKWKKNAVIKPDNIFEMIFMTYLIKRANNKRNTIMIDVILYNISLIASLIYIYFLVAESYLGFGMVWGVVVGIQLVLFLVFNSFKKTSKK